MQELETMLDEAINIEDYSKAARLRDEIAKRK
jgi:protein-arginine kinase activator protein McsA